MATVNKNFRIKQGLVVEGSTGTIGGQNILTETGGDQYILNLIGGETLVKSVLGNLSVNSAGALSLNQNLLAGEMAGDYLFTNGDDNLNVDVEGIATDLTGSYGFATTTNISDAIADEVARANIAYDTAGSALAAQGNAEDYTDTALQSYTPTSSLDTTVGGYGYLKSADLAGYATETYADNAAAGALEDAQTYADALINDSSNSSTQVWSAYKTNTEIGLAQSNAETYADNKIDDTSTATDKSWSAYKTNTEIGLAEGRANTYTDEAVADLVNSAPSTLDTLKELADALQSNPDVIQDLQDVAAGKQDTLTAGANIDITGSTISVTGLDTDDVAEGSNLYFTNQRAIDAVGGSATSDNTPDTVVKRNVDGNFAANDITANEISIGSIGRIYDDGGTLVIENIDGDDVTINADDIRLYAQDDVRLTAGVGGDVVLTTDTGSLRLEGSNIYAGTNLQYVDSERVATQGYVDDAQADAEATAQTALDNVLNATTPFTDLNINDVAKQVASRVTSLGSVPVTAYQFNKSSFKSGKFLVKIDNGTHNEISEILVTLDSSGNVAITEYAIVGTNGSRGTITADVDATHCRIRVTPVDDSTITVAGTVFNA
jgi:hypothetical protein